LSSRCAALLANTSAFGLIVALDAGDCAVGRALRSIIASVIVLAGFVLRALTLVLFREYLRP
jgi:hypothetical protein